MKSSILLLAQVGYAYDQNVGGFTYRVMAVLLVTADRDGYSVAAAWKPADAGLIPSISTGFSSTADDRRLRADDIDSWYVGLEWSDVFIEGNSFGGAIGSAPNFNDGDDTTPSGKSSTQFLSPTTSPSLLPSSASILTDPMTMTTCSAAS